MSLEPGEIACGPCRAGKEGDGGRDAERPGEVSANLVTFDFTRTTVFPFPLGELCSPDGTESLDCDGED